METITWLRNSLRHVNAQDRTPHIYQDSLWLPIAGFSQYGCIFCIYKGINHYCVHVGDEWEHGDEPNMGVYDINMNWNELLSHIANKYDMIRQS